MTLLATVCLLVLLACMLPCLYRIAVGPDALDRLMAFDLIGVLVAVALAVFALIEDSWAYLEISMGFAVLAFVGTLAIASYLDRRRSL